MEQYKKIYNAMVLSIQNEVKNVISSNIVEKNLAIKNKPQDSDTPLQLLAADIILKEIPDFIPQSNQI